MVQTLNVIGPGRVGQTLMRLATDAGLRVQDVAGRDFETTSQAIADLGCGRATRLADMRPADIWCLCVPDRHISRVADTLAGVTIAPTTALHFSGFHPAEIMATLRPAGWHLASLHPVTSFADPKTARARFAGTPCGIEGDAPAVAQASAFAHALGGLPFVIRSENKALYHAAAVFSNNLTTVLQAIAEDAWAETGVAPDMARVLQERLLRDALENISALGPQNALTGPAARGDTDVVAHQGRAVAAWDAEAGEIYRLLSEKARRLKTRATE